MTGSPSEPRTTEEVRPFTLTVFCGAHCDPAGPFAEAASKVGAAAAQLGWRIVFGGGNHGLMGALSAAVLEGGGSLVAVIPRHLVTSESVVFPPGVAIERTATMRERKERMDTLCDAFLALPGGMGTLEELAEVMTLRQLAVHDRPILVLDLDGFWEPFRGQLRRAVDAGVAEESILDLAEFLPDVEAAVARVAANCKRRPKQLPVRVRRRRSLTCRSTS